MYKTAYHFSMQKPYASLHLNNKFPEDIERIIHSPHPDKGSLYISNIEAAENLNTLKKHRITAVMSCAKGYELKHPLTAIPHYKYIPTVDKDECDLSCHFDQAVDFITKNLVHTNVLVHCIAGVSRSVSMVLAYFIRQHKMEYQDAYNLVKSKRKIIHPNDGFIRQLKHYSQTKAGVAEKKRDLSPVTKTGALTYAKRNNYFENNELIQFKSVQFIEDSVKAKQQENSLAQYKSNQLTPKKLSYQPLTTKNQYNESNQGLYRTTTTFFTPNKTNYTASKEQILQMYSKHPKTQNINRYPADDNVLNAQSTTENRQYKNISPTTKVEDKRQTGRKQQFEEMNRELSQKIEKIRQKYQNERKKLYERYQSGDKKQQSPVSNKKNATIDNFYQDKTALQDRKVSLTLDKYRQRRDDYIRSPILREDKATPQPRNKINIGVYNDLGQLYSKKFENIYTTKNYKNDYKNDYKWQSRLDAAKYDRARGAGYGDNFRYNYDYSFKRY